MRSTNLSPVAPLRCLGLALLLTALTGCSWNPIPAPGYVVDAPRDDWRIYHLRHTAIVDRQTTLAELQAHLGPPDQTSADGRTVGYLWDVTRWNDARVEVGSKRASRVEYDENGNYAPGLSQRWYNRNVKMSYVNRYSTRRHFLLLGVDDTGVVQWSRRFHRDSSNGPLPTMHQAIESAADDPV